MGRTEFLRTQLPSTRDFSKRNHEFSLVSHRVAELESFHLPFACILSTDHLDVEMRPNSHSFVSASSRFKIKLLIAVQAATSVAFNVESASDSPVRRTSVASAG